MRYIKKYIYWLSLSLILITLLLYGVLSTEATLPEFRLPNGESLSIFQSEDGVCYVFLPAYAAPEQLTAVCPDAFTLNGISIENGSLCSDIALDTAYRLEVPGFAPTTLRFCRSANVPSLHINTRSGSMTQIHSDQSHEEESRMSLYTADGILHCTDSLCTLQGRGNSTWLSKKKPYTLTLSTASGLLGMSESTKWTLLANSFDQTNLRNKLVLDFAERVGPGWAPSGEFVDVYFNGTYFGLYLLTEGIGTAADQLELDFTSGEFLCTTSFETSNTFLSSLNRNIEVCVPKSMSPADLQRIQALVAEMEQMITSGADLQKLPTFDLDSWVRRYLIDELFCNIDADRASSYFYCKDGVFLAGPIWDYDVTMGNNNVNREPTAFYAKTYRKYSGYLSPYYHHLYQNPSFYQAVCRIYRTEYLPAIEQLLNDHLPALSARIAAAAQMNALRWQTSIEPAGFLADYLRKRTDFLTSTWVDGTEYCTVQFQVDTFSGYRGYSVPKGTLLDLTNTDLIDTDWIISSTGERFDPALPVTEDLVLTAQAKAVPPPSVPESGFIDTQTLLTGASLFLFGLFLAILLRTDHHRRRQEKEVR